MTTQGLAKVNDLRGMLEKAKGRLQEVAPKHLKVERLIRLLLSAGSRNPKILQCSPESVLQFAMKCSETGLEPIGAGGAWAIPFDNHKNKTVELQFIPDYRGLMNCAKRADCIKDAFAEVVHEKDEFDYQLGLEPRLEHKPARGDRGELEAAYCVIVFPDGTKRFIVMDKQEVEGIRKRSRAGNNGPWITDRAEMWKKTVVRRAMKSFSGASPELNAAIEADNAAAEVIDVTPKEPIALPETTDGQPIDDEQQEQRQEPSKPPKAAAKAAAAKEVPLEDEIDPNWLTALGVQVTLIGAPAKKNQPFRISTAEHGPFKTWSEDLAGFAAKLEREKVMATFYYEEQPAKDPKYPADQILKSIVRNE